MRRASADLERLAQPLRSVPQNESLDLQLVEELLEVNDFDWIRFVFQQALQARYFGLELGEGLDARADPFHVPTIH